MELDPATRETLARAVHEAYLERFAGGPDDPETRRWEALPEETREANRAQVDDIVSKAALIGCAITGSSDADAAFAFADAEIELLARQEHDRWMAERSGAGWVFGDPRDDEAKRHPDLIPFEDHSEEDKEKDREAVRRIPELLRSAGYGLRR